ncbi:hypothetical protein [Streptomyces fuscigenes]|uniref:hypothetical protein n=1 Tax=Streptomyces fuscigenes TaxID=1528880 RepID=UPI001F33D763|nr:hypothetical protein [Streptomyces fuscigenes]MCF3964885.1 hypothetical protein [Streptomyces fuscigenes]
MRTRSRIIAATAAAAAALAVTTTLGAATASAATAAIGTGRVQLCSEGGYSSSLVFSASGIATQRTVFVPAGQCQTFNVPFAASLGVWGQDSDGTPFNVPGPSLRSSPSHAGMKLAAEGTTTAPRFVQLANS